MPENAATPATPTDQIPKQEFDRLRTQSEETNRTLQALQQQLTDPDYLEYRAAKSKPPAIPAGAPANVGNMSLEQLQALIAQGVSHTVQSVIKPLYERMDQADAQLELDAVMRKYEDFDDYREAVANTLNNTKNELTIEQAYLMAKASAAPSEEGAAPANAGAPAGAAPPKGNEKPSASVPVDGDTIKKFKDANTAGTAAWTEVAARHGLSGDTI